MVACAVGYIVLTRGECEVQICFGMHPMSNIGEFSCVVPLWLLHTKAFSFLDAPHNGHGHPRRVPPRARSLGEGTSKGQSSVEGQERRFPAVPGESGGRRDACQRFCPGRVKKNNQTNKNKKQGKHRKTTEAN